ncbi:hypothetical protein E4T56_gene12768 [Termitomyces sp. T112]|nr:hypothetical protein E4T56_gene12768 [Termitomyces sp. T112]
MVLSPDNFPAHLPSHTSHTLLHCTALPFSANSVPTLVDSGATNDFIDKSLATPPDNSATPPDPTTTAPSPTFIDPKALDIKNIGAVSFTHILQNGTPTFQLQITLALSEGYLHAETTLPEQKTEEQILHKVVPLDYHAFADTFSGGSTKELPLHCSYNHKINFKEGISPLFGKIYNMSKIKLQALKDYLNDMLSKGFICPLISTIGALVLFAKKKYGSPPTLC